MRVHTNRRIQRSDWVNPLLLFVVFMVTLPAFATKGVFQGRVVEGSKREAGRYIYVAGRGGYMRRVNIQKCRVIFGADVPPSQRVASASDSLKDSAEVRVTAEQGKDGEWMASEIVILKMPAVDKVRLLI